MIRDLLQNIKFKIIFSGLLLIISAVLIFIYFRDPSADSKVVSKDQQKRIFTVDEIKNLVPRDIDTMLFTYGIKKEWIKDQQKEFSGKPNKITDRNKSKEVKEIKNKPANAEFLFQKDISLPFDISTIELTADLSTMFRYYGLSEYINEDPRKKDLNIDLSLSNDSLKKVIGNVRLIYNEKIKREAADVCIIINNIIDYELKDAESVLKSGEGFSVVLPLNLEKSDLQSLINESKRDYVIHCILGTSDDLEADMKSDGKEKEWKIKIKGFANEFSKTSGVIIDNKRKDKIFDDKIFDELLKNKLAPYNDTVLIKFLTKEIGSKKVNELFTNIISRTSAGRTTLVYLVNFTPDEFTYFDSQVHNLKKRGYKFLSFKDIMRRVSSAVIKEQEEIKKGNTADSVAKKK